MNKRIRIGVCTAIINQLSMHRMMNEFCREARKRNFELHIFTSFSNLDHETNNDRIQQEVFQFLRHEKIDAVVFFADMIKSPEVQKTIADIANSMNIPIIGVKSAISGIYNINYDVVDAIRKITTHLIEEHGCRKINFISGNKGDIAFDHRLKAYTRTLEKYHIEVEEQRILYGGFWWGPTREALDAYFADGNDLPEAFVCANDAMAIATCKYLQEKGFVIPRDVKVTGIGGISEIEYFSPALTTAKYDPKTTCKCLCDVLEQMLRENIYPAETVRIPCEIDFTESCGCSAKERATDKETVSELFSRLEEERDFRHDINDIIIETNENPVIDTVLSGVPKYLDRVGANSCGLYLSEKFGEIVDIPFTDLEDEFPVILLGLYSNGTCEKVIKPITLEEYGVSQDRIAGDGGHVMMIPIHSDKDFFGLFAINYDADHLAPEFLYELCVIIKLCMDAIFKRYKLDLANHKLRMVSEETVLALAEIVEARSEVTGQHVKRVSEYTKILAEGLGFSEEDVHVIRIASMMHDVGKIKVPSEILEKPGKLTKEEFDIIKTHVTAGESLLKKFPGVLMQKTSVIAKQHHEKWNGTGYLGMKGEEIALEARIVALADVFDALVSKRPYKPAFDAETAIRIITEDSGKHFDPMVVECFLNHLDEFLETKEFYKDN